jgi:ParB family chromosome partitioning protein
MGYRQLMDRFGHTQEKLAEGLSKSRSHIANLLRLLNLPDEVQDFLREGKLTAGHARALVTAQDPVRLAKEAISRGLSVREVERMAKGEGPATAQTGAKKAATVAPEKDADTRALEGDLAATIGMAVSIDHTGDEGGSVTIAYKSLDDLDRICQALSHIG